MAIRVDYDDKNFGTFFEIGDVVQGIKDEIHLIYGRDLEGNDIEGVTGKVIAANDKYPGATLTIEIEKTKDTFQTHQWNVKFLGTYASTMSRKQIRGGR